MFMVWAFNMALYEEESQEKVDFYNALTEDLLYEKRQVKEEYDRLYKEAQSGLGRWEFVHLNQDGDPKVIQKEARAGKEYL